MFNKLVAIEPVSLIPSAEEALHQYAKEVVLYRDIPASDDQIVQRIGDADAVLLSYTSRMVAGERPGPESCLRQPAECGAVHAGTGRHRTAGLDSRADGKADRGAVSAGRRKRRNGGVRSFFRGKFGAERVKQKMLPCDARKHFFVEISRKLCYAISAAERRRGTANNGRRFGPHFRKEVSTCQLL